MAHEVLVGHEDWSHLVFAFQESPTFRDGVHGGDVENELPTQPASVPTRASGIRDRLLAGQ